MQLQTSPRSDTLQLVFDRGSGSINVIVSNYKLSQALLSFVPRLDSTDPMEMHSGADVTTNDRSLHHCTFLYLLFASPGWPRTTPLTTVKHPPSTRLGSTTAQNVSRKTR